MKKIAFLLVLVISISSFAQQNLVQVIASGDGKTKDEALNAALRHCIEKTFGVFVSTNTTVSNDSLLKDNIATIASGNIASYNLISEVQNADLFTTTVSAQVSPENVVKIMKSKGYEFEVKGSVYAQEILKENFYATQEVEIFRDFLDKWKKIPVYDFTIETSNTPQKVDNEIHEFYDSQHELDAYIWFDKNVRFNVHGEPLNERINTIEVVKGAESYHYYFKDSGNLYLIRSVFTRKENENYALFKKELLNMLKELSIKDNINNYETLNGDTYSVKIQSETYQFRNSKVKDCFKALQNYLFYNSIPFFYELKNKDSYLDKLLFVSTKAFYRNYNNDGGYWYRIDGSSFDLDLPILPSFINIYVTLDQLSAMNKIEFIRNEDELTSDLFNSN